MLEVNQDELFYVINNFSFWQIKNNNFVDKPNLICRNLMYDIIATRSENLINFDDFGKI